MASLEDLPADQRAVLQMVLQRGRSYDEIASLLSIDRSAVRQRALDGCDALTPAGIEPGPEQGLVTDYLLSQLPGEVAEEVRVYLQGADEDRAWAAAIATRLEGLASKPLPEIPVAAPQRSDEPAAAAKPHLAPPAERGLRLSTAPRRRRRNLLAGLGAICAVVVVVVVVVVLLGSGGSKSTLPHHAGSKSTVGHRAGSKSPVANSAGSCSRSAAQARTIASGSVLAALNLTSPTGATHTIGVAEVICDDGIVGIAIDAQGVPANSTHNAYGLWLYNSPTSNRFVGFDPDLVGKNERLALDGKLPAGAVKYKHLMITLETHQHPRTPGKVVLFGPFRES